MTVNTKSTADASKTRGVEEVDQNSSWILPELNEEGIRAKLTQCLLTSRLTQLPNQLIRDNSVKKTHGIFV